MSISKSVDGDSTTITFKYTAPTVKVEQTLTDAAKDLYDKLDGHGVELFDGRTVDDLTNTEIGTIVDTYVKRVLKEAAKAYYVNNEQDTARQDAEIASETRFL